MPRSLTFGYNAALAIDELVIDRYIGADYDEMAIVDSFAHDFDESGAAGTAHIHFTKPHLGFDALREGRNTVLRIDELRVVVFFSSTPPGFDNPDDFAVSASIEFSLERDMSTGDLRPHFAGITTGDVSVACLDPDPDENPSKALIIETIMTIVIVQALTGGRFSGITMPLNVGEDSLYSDALDVVILDDDSLEDKDTLNLAFYEEGHDETRGLPSAVPNFMVDGKTVTFRLSRAVFELMVARFINGRFMRFEMQVAREEYTENRIRISPPDDSHQITIEGQPAGTHSRVSGRIENRTQSRSVSFSTDDSGVFSVTMEAEIGDTLVFHGNYFSDSSSGTSVRIYPPSLQLRDGSISISGSAWVDRLGAMDIEYDGNVYLRIDPVTGQIVPGADVEVDLPCLGDFIMFLISLLIGPFVGLLYSWFDEAVADEVRDVFAESGLALLPGLEDPNRIVTFVEDLQIQNNGIIVSGQMDAGSIHNAGRTDEASLNLDSATFRFDREGMMVTVSRANMQHMIGPSFEQLGPDELRDPSILFPERTISLPSLTDFDGRVFAIHTEQNRYAKVRIDLEDGVRSIIRWVTYNPPTEPGIEIVGVWENDGEWGSDGGHRWGGADRYWGTFSFDCIRLHTDGPLQIEWEYEPRLGLYSEEIPSDIFTFIPVGSNDMQRYLEVRTDGLEERFSYFSVVITVTVTDVFGRTATATHQVTVQKRYEELVLPSFERRRGDPWDDPRRSAKEWYGYEERGKAIEEETDERERRDKEMGTLRDKLIETAIEIDEELEARSARSARMA